MLAGKRIVIGVTGSIAAYKAAVLIRGLVKAGAEVKVVMTASAKEFITPLTLATLSKNPILVDFFDPEDGRWNSHVSLGEWADALLIAPATANTLGKMAAGIADNLLTTTYLSAKCPVLAAPAMDLDMYAHPATQKNLETLRGFGCHIIEPASGELASGLTGKGRMAEPEEIIAALALFLSQKKSLSGKRIMVTAGATMEAIDPVRYISNHSTGKMGCAIAAELLARGADVVLIKGKISVPVPAGVMVVEALSAADMYDAAIKEFTGCNAAVMCAAVADYTPALSEPKKVKKNGQRWNLEITRTKDIAAALGATKGKKVLAGFALETDDEILNAEGKLAAKNFDFIVLNSLRDEGAGFGHDTNKITVIRSGGKTSEFSLKSKAAAAADIADILEEYFDQNSLRN